ncbi:restriction endonuclease subunit S [Pseudomonas syringae]|uniref:restriction endonuclease subunit S n=1 Tax=Pseudomonas syringae TaxID=317 RepID=UPI001BCA823C|nr:restriction endonuclease subunit S [Pseudomonas syringae]MBS7418100.1 restriction endonuclease subunit S [Pseudomonas syringae]
MSNKTTTGALDDTIPAPPPKLRFPAFREASAWEVFTLGKLTQVVRGGSPRPIDGFITTSADGLSWLKIGDVDKEAKYVTHTAEKVRPEALSKTRVVNPGDLILSNSMSFGRPYILQIATCIHDGWIAITKISKKTDRDFLYYLILAPNSQSYFVDHAAGSGVLNLNADIIKALRVCIPSPPEQKKIAECLSSVDELIAAQAGKLDALKAHKKGLMQQLFPREGETQPRLRFPEFQNAGEWEVKSLSEVIDLVSGMHLSPDDYSSTGEVPYFTGPSDFTNDLSNVTKWTKQTANISQAEDTLITVKGSGVGEVWYLTLPEVAVGRQLMAVRSKNGSSRFMFQFLLTKRSRFEDLGSGNLIPGLSRAAILELEACLPKPPEQQRIADCLTSLDELIAVQTQKHAALKTHKKGLMQQLFPAHAEVKA